MTTDDLVVRLRSCYPTLRFHIWSLNEHYYLEVHRKDEPRTLRILIAWIREHSGYIQKPFHPGRNLSVISFQIN